MATVGTALYWGFTVDDALISARVAHHLATGLGYRFNGAGPVVDAVTPLGWAHLLAPFARSGVIQGLFAARMAGTLAWLGSAAWLGAHVAGTGGRLWPLTLLAWLAPLGIWASSGMETGIVTACVTLGLARGGAANACLAWAAAWRPELIPFAACFTLLRTPALQQLPRSLGVVLGLPLLVALVRWRVFGVPYPLSSAAKPSDLTQGFWYALEALFWSGPLWLWIAPGWPFVSAAEAAPASVDRPGITQSPCWQWIRSRLPGVPSFERDVGALAVSIFVHAGAVALAGGDWMPAYRLFVPVMPAMLFVACHVPRRSRVLVYLGALLALLASLRIATKLGPSARHVLQQRTLLVQSAAETLSSARVVAAPDVGWVGAAFAGTIVDLAGVTDPAIAYLRGGHTSKMIESRLFVARRVDHVIVLLAKGEQVEEPWTESRFARRIDQRAALLAAELGCAPSTTLPLEFAGQSYLVIECPPW